LKIFLKKTQDIVVLLLTNAFLYATMQTVP